MGDLLHVQSAAPVSVEVAEDSRTVLLDELGVDLIRSHLISSPVLVSIVVSAAHLLLTHTHLLLSGTHLSLLLLTISHLLLTIARLLLTIAHLLLTVASLLLSVTASVHFNIIILDHDLLLSNRSYSL